ncbi:ImmA/IrrE family metallo-endopeptidase [Burkholderia gladioli]|uniref:ImmA/IrrE family metallo-endopeptidase n=1 Tax=Burkholderia gladioli TaxID=28095 RepID=UPI0016419B52|nr:XRE family transcriptional regulator [Burkholderia gladioli]
MERIQSINPERIRWCCVDQGTTPDALASATGIAPATLERVLAGQDGLSFAQLSRIAAYFGRGTLFFLEPQAVDATAVHTAAFRTLANHKPELTPKLRIFIERVEQQRDIYRSLREDLDGADLPRFAPPLFPAGRPALAAKVVRAWLGLAEHNSFDSYRAAVEARGILVFRSNGYNGKWQIAKESPILGFSLHDRDDPVIVVKKQAFESQQSFTLMHELGHLLLHQESSIDDEHDMHSHEGHEREANTFAGHLLVPARFLARVDDATRPREVSGFDAWLKPLRQDWSVSTEVILRRLMDEGRLSQEKYLAYRHWRANQPLPDQDAPPRMYRHREPVHIFGDRFVRTVLDALANRNITLAKASRYLDSLKISDLHQLERHYAGV